MTEQKKYLVRYRLTLTEKELEAVLTTPDFTVESVEEITPAGWTRPIYTRQLHPEYRLRIEL